jgi:hypothetical protein
VHGIWRGVRERVEALAAQPGAGAVFGTSGHGFRLDAPLTEDQLADWEMRVGATLPAVYRSFLTEVAAAGAGPFYGLLGFRVTDGIAHWVGDKWQGADQLDLRVAFPHRDEFRPEPWPQDDDDAYGTIPLAHQGCGYYDLLVVNGPDAGHVWQDNRACDGPISPYVDDTGRTTFDRWYLTWLEQAEGACARHSTA